MLLRFMFKNFGSFRDAAELSFVATRIKDDDVHGALPPKGPFAKFGVLPVLALYGANASGKSTALDALRRMVSHVLRSHTELKPTDKIPHKPFKLDLESSAQPTHLECELLIDGVRYQYGFLVTKDRFEEEWLQAWPAGVEQLWFHRKGDDRDAWYFGPALKGERKRIAAATRENSLFLSAAAQNNHEQLGKLYRAFDELFSKNLPSDSHHPMSFSASPLFDPERADEVRRLLRAADVGVMDFRLKSDKDGIKAHIDQWQRSSDETIAQRAIRLSAALESIGDVRHLELQHEGADGLGHWLDPDEESDGTISLINRLHQILLALNLGALTFIDELDRSLHPLLCVELIKMFTSPYSNPNGAQLLFTTHDVSLMEHLRRDEVALVNKQNDGGSRIELMSEYKLLRRDDMQKVYMEGRVGGLPRLGSLGRALALVNREE
ncbi:ATP-binding protein [Myxococcota bacterium]|nr:ATP-binding protein [Myxococcota bacterium]